MEYEISRQAGLPPRARTFPATVQRYFSNVSGYEPAVFIERLLRACDSDVLVVGAGRDAFWLASAGQRVVSVDIVMQSDVPDLVLADMANLPFADASVDAVVAADVIEHTFDDRQALLEFRRVLRPGGALIANIPFGDDAGKHHVRVYTEATFRRLLEATGFCVDECVYRGAFPLMEQYVPGIRALFHGFNLLSYILLRRNHYGRLLEWMTESDWQRGRSPGLCRFARVHCAYSRAIVGHELRDFLDVNRVEYEHQAASIAAAFLARSGGAS